MHFGDTNMDEGVRIWAAGSESYQGSAGFKGPFKREALLYLFLPACCVG